MFTHMSGGWAQEYCGPLSDWEFMVRVLLCFRAEILCHKELSIKTFKGGRLSEDLGGTPKHLC